MEEKRKNLKSNKQVTLRELIQAGEQRLRFCHKADASIDAKLLASYVLGYSNLELILNSNLEVSQEDEVAYEGYISQRCSGRPLQHITKEQEFMGLTFYVDHHVLIPRQDTETLIEVLVEKSRSKPFKKIIEVGVGSGCISISLAKFIPSAQITGLDISKEALEIAKKNAINNQVDHQIEWVYGDLLKDYKAKDKVDLIVSNPPYITSNDCCGLEADVREYEPMLALDGGEDGLEFYREITKQAREYLVKGGLLAYEIGYNQSEDVRIIMERAGFAEIEQIKDLANKDRIVLGILKDTPTK